MFERICINQARTHVFPRWDCSSEWFSKEQSWSLELAQRHWAALNRSHGDVVAHGSSSAETEGRHKRSLVPGKMQVTEVAIVRWFPECMT